MTVDHIKFLESLVHGDLSGEDLVRQYFLRNGGVGLNKFFPFLGVPTSGVILETTVPNTKHWLGRFLHAGGIKSSSFRIDTKKPNEGSFTTRAVLMVAGNDSKTLKLFGKDFEEGEVIQIYCERMCGGVQDDNVGGTFVIEELKL